MSDPVLSYLTLCQEELVGYYTEVVKSSPNLFPLYSQVEPKMLYARLKAALEAHIRGVEQGDFEEVKSEIHRIFSKRLRSGFDPNELIRMTNLITSLVVQAIDHAPNAEEALQKFYRQRSDAIAQVAKMYTAILNLSIPKEERNEIDPALLELVK